MHEVEELVEVLPAAQAVHLEEPVLSLKLPAAQATGASPSAPVYPAFAWQAVLPFASPVLEFFGQAVHGALPVEALKVSTGQAIAASPSAPEYPA